MVKCSCKMSYLYKYERNTRIKETFLIEIQTLFFHDLFFNYLCAKYCILAEVTSIVGLSPFQNNFFVNESPLKMMKNTFYFILKALFLLKIFNFFVLTFWSCRKNSLIRNLRLISKLMTSQSS